MAPKFGTSGLRGLVVDLTPALVAGYTRAFLTACPHGGALHLGWDLRPSSEGIATCVAEAAQAAGLEVTLHGTLPTPALAGAAMAARQAAIMITGSHIPADRNGLKFYVPGGEISKADEAAILTALDGAVPDAESVRPPGSFGRLSHSDAAIEAYVDRYVGAFGLGALTGLRLGLYEHSSVARDVLGRIAQALGAQTVPLARSEVFVPVDTEAVDPQTRRMLTGWARDHALDAILSTDGDGDRPMLADAAGRIVPGDRLGPITARFVGARQIVTPVSSNSLVQAMTAFDGVMLTRIGSPYVIEGMQAALARDPGCRVAGYEANGGFLLGFEAKGPAGPLAPLMTRDSLLPLLAPLVEARAAGQSLAALVAGLPPRFTAADRLQDVPADVSGGLIDALGDSAGARASFFATMGPETALDRTDGLRVQFAGGDVVHLRPSGNAPECRCYVEADSPDRAKALLRTHMEVLAAHLR